MRIFGWRTMAGVLSVALVGLVVWAEERPNTAGRSGSPDKGDTCQAKSCPVPKNAVDPVAVPPSPPAFQIELAAGSELPPPIPTDPKSGADLKPNGAKSVPVPVPADPPPPPPLKGQPISPSVPSPAVACPPAPPATPTMPPAAVPMPPDAPVIAPMLPPPAPLPPSVPVPEPTPPPAPPTPLEIAPPPSPPPPPAPKVDPKVTPAALTGPACQLHLKMGNDHPRFEIRNGDAILLKARCDRIDMQSPAEGIKTFVGLQASGRVHVTATGLEGDCDQLTILSQSGQIMLKGNVRLVFRKGKQQTEMATEQMLFQMGPTGLSVSRTAGTVGKK